MLFSAQRYELLKLYKNPFGVYDKEPIQQVGEIFLFTVDMRSNKILSSKIQKLK